ncbi:MAG: methyltransferase domain-containing protein [Myxococcales bacterium]|nr:methyltransferase domain-containing protein [Myxococcales bacterium]
MSNTRNVSQETGQYTRHSILRYEKIFGADFTSTGGLAVVKELCASLELRPGMRVLDVGSGLGGTAFYMAKTYGVEVLGVDLSEQMIEITNDRVKERETQGIRFVLDDVCTMPLEEQSFDLVWSRDCFLHIPNKDVLLKKLYSLTKPGGHILVTDYARRKGQVSEEFERYFTKSGYHLLDLEAYGALFEQAGYVDVEASDRTKRFVELLHQEMELLQSERERFLADFPAEDLDYLLRRWADKVGYCGEGSMVFAQIHGRRA